MTDSVPSDLVRYEVRERVAVITVNDPDRRNAVTDAMSGLLRDAVARAEEDPGVHAVVVTGAGKAYCAGADLSALGAAARDGLERIYAGFMAVGRCTLPTIAAVNGAAAGAGANLALGCDVVIACESASFIQAFTRIGLVPDAGGTHWLPRQIGLARAMGAMLFADKISARQAADWGMIYEAVPDDSFAAHWRARAAALAAGPGLAYRGIKQALRVSFAQDLDAQLALEARLQGECGGSADFREGVAAFLQKRAPKFSGR